MNTYPSKLVEEAVNELAKLPGIGRKTALRLVLTMLKQDVIEIEALSNALVRLKKETTYCSNCHCIAESSLCDICANPNRDHSIICVVQDIRDVIAIENTSQYKGVYHVLGGIISPMDGIGPNDLTIDNLINKISKGGVKELIMALPTTIEGDTTNFYIYKKIKQYPILVSTIARGIAIGDDLEFADEVTLGRSIVNRTPYEYQIKQ